MVVMMQKEVADRIAAKPERKLMVHYQLLSNIFMEASVAFIVPKQFCAAAQC